MSREVLLKPKFRIDKGYIYFLNDNGDVCRIKEIGEQGKKPKVEMVKKLRVEKEPEFVYFVDGESQICCVFIGKKRKKKSVSGKKQK